MYLTRFPINTARAEARRLLGSPRLLHGAVNMAFPEPPAHDGQGPRVLWRVDRAQTGRANLFVVSPTPPDLTHLREQAGWPSLPGPGWTTFAYAEFLNALQTGDIWAFRLTANPVHQIRKESDAPGTPTKRTAHVTSRHQIGWLLKHQERAGFEVLPRAEDTTGTTTNEYVNARQNRNEDGGKGGDSGAHQVIVHTRTPLQFSKPRTDGGHNVRFTRVTFDGRLRITDLEAFHRTLTQGLGKAKAYGCGLMTLAPVKGLKDS